MLPMSSLAAMADEEQPEASEGDAVVDGTEEDLAAGLSAASFANDDKGKEKDDKDVDTSDSITVLATEKHCTDHDSTSYWKSGSSQTINGVTITVSGKTVTATGGSAELCVKGGTDNSGRLALADGASYTVTFENGGGQNPNISYVVVYKVTPTVTPDGEDEDGPQKVTICHATAAGTYTSNSLPKWQIYAAGGHSHGNETSVHPDDIIPPFAAGSHGGQSWGAFDGFNWTPAGQLIHGNGCVDDSTVVTPPSIVPTASFTSECVTEGTNANTRKVTATLDNNVSTDGSVDNATVDYQIVRTDSGSDSVLDTVTVLAGATGSWTGYVPDTQTWTLKVVTGSGDAATSIANGSFTGNCTTGGDENPVPPVPPSPPVPPVPPVKTLSVTGSEVCQDLVPSFVLTISGDNLTADSGSVELRKVGGTGLVTHDVDRGRNTLPWPSGGGLSWEAVAVTVSFDGLTDSLTLDYSEIEVECTEVLPEEPVDQEPTPVDPVDPDDPDGSENPPTPAKPVVTDDKDDDEVLGVVRDRKLPRTGASTLELLVGGLAALGLGGLLLRRREQDA
ncbi:LPXTG cell wall anchor domain-containing protein [Egicoccus sp. AB-alg6-2]|uniref:LPXTG cell wall anchor domain-containing protein n=1 Tax=Egicoccus sp. AB-alg6-2 TaxID=3242692 RepID=UPI00359E1C8E